MKKIWLPMLLVTVFSFFVGITKSMAYEYTNYNGIKMTEEEYDTLLNLGFSENEIYVMDDTTYEANKNLDAKLISRTVKYYRVVQPVYGNQYEEEISEEEFNASTSADTFDRSITAYKSVVSSISANGSKYRYNVSVAWTSFPSVRSYDIIGIGITTNVYINSSVYFNYTYSDTNGNYTTSTAYYDRKSTSTGGAAVYKLPTGLITSLSSNLYFDVSKNTSGTITTLGMCGDYAHATSNVPVGNVSDYSIGYSGISLGSSLAGYYDSMPCVMSYENVSW